MHNYPLPLSFDVSNFRSTFQNFTRLNTRGSDQLLLLTSPPPPPPRILIFSKPFFPFLYIRHTPSHEYLRIFDARLLLSRFYRLEIREESKKKKGKERKKKKVSKERVEKRWETFRASKCCAPLCVEATLSSIFSSEPLNVNSTSRGRVSLFKLLCALVFTRAWKILGRVVEGEEGGLQRREEEKASFFPRVTLSLSLFANNANSFQFFHSFLPSN